MADLKSVLEGDSTGSDMGDESVSGSSYDAFSTKLADVLGLPPEKAEELRDVICGLAQEEMGKMHDTDEESMEEETPASAKEEKKPSLAVVIGMGKSKK